MTIRLEKLAKRFNYEWIFRDITLTFEEGKAYAITGPNGSGKSTLMRILSGQLSPSQGELSFLQNGQKITPDEVFQYVAYAAPYMDLIDEFTLSEFLSFHCSLRPMRNNMHVPELIDAMGLKAHTHKQIRSFSSGMKQRVKLLVACFTQSKIVLLDEPATNLDNAGYSWYIDIVQPVLKESIVIVASNIEREYTFCTDHLNIMGYK
ncbi:MAG: ABC transporter ATP-binding protein [Chitinophagales bacterium]